MNKIVVDAAGNIYAATRGQFCNTSGIFKSTDGGTSFTLVLTDATCTVSYFGSDIEIAADGTLYAGMGIFNFAPAYGSVWKSATGNAGSWTKLNIGGASGFPATGFHRVKIACAPSSAATVYVTTQSSATNGLFNIYKTTNAGTTWESTNGGTSWTSVEGNLPDMPIRWAEFSPWNSSMAFLATELGVWSTNLLNGGATNWGATNTGLANVRVDMLKIRASDKTMAAATHGRGLYTTTVPDPAPVDLLSFTAECNAGNVNLQWTTASESNNNYFVIERSINAKTFNEVMQVRGAGNSSTTKKYSATDYDAVKGKIYYRLKQVDYNGNNKTYAPITVSCDDENDFSFTVNSNPITNGNIYITINGLNDEKVLVVLRDVLGKELYSKVIIEDADSYLFSIDLQDKLSPGIYFVTASNNDEYLSRKIIVK